MSIYRRVLRYYQLFWGKTIIGLFLSMVGIGLNLLKPWPFKIIVDDFLRPTPAARGDWSTWVPLLCLALVVIQFIWGIINWITNYLFVKIGLQALLKLRTDLYAHLQRLSLKFHDARRSADSSFRVAYDSQSIQTIYNKGFTNIFASVIALIGTFIVMLRLDWVLTLLSLAIVPLIVGAIYFFARRIRSESTSIQEQESAVLAQAQEGLSSIRMVHAFGREDFEVQAISSTSAAEFAGKSAADVNECEQRAGDQHADGYRHGGDVLRRNFACARRDAEPRFVTGFQRLSPDAVSTIGIPNVHGLGDGRRYSRRETLF